MSKIKRLATLGLIFLLSINSFAISISDNDGSAFITKAEFDALKSNFQSQIDNYNNGIDSKIDAAIASYLAGIRISSEIELDNYMTKYAITGTETKNTSTGEYYQQPLLWYSGSDKSYSVHNTQYQYPTWYVMNYFSAINDGGAANDKSCNSYGMMSAPADKKTRRIFIDDSGNATSIMEFGININGYGVGHYHESWYSSTSSCDEGGWTMFTVSNFKTGTQVRNGKCGVHTKLTDNGSYYQYVTGLFTRDYTEAYHSDTMALLAPLNTNNEYTVYEDPEKSSISWTTKSSLDAGWKTISAPSTLPTSCNTRTYSSNVLYNVTNIGWPSTSVFYGCGTEVAMNAIIWNSLTSICDANKSIKYGLALTQAQQDGNVKIDYNLSQAGYVLMWAADSLSDVKWGGFRTSETDTTTWKVDSNWEAAGAHTKNIENVEKDQYIFLIYLPTNSSKTLGSTGRVTVNSCIETINT